MNFWGFLIVAAGLFSICGAVGDWDWFLNSRKALFFVTFLGRGGARIVHVALGLML